MPRSVSGNYTLPLPPVVPNTVITSAWANTTLDDVALALTNSLDRYGNGGLVGALRLQDGSETLPAWAFNAETGTGMWRESAGVLSLSIQGAKVAEWTSAGYAVSGVLAVDDIFATNITADLVTAGAFAGAFSFTTLHVTGAAQFDSTVNVDGVATFNSNVGIGTVTPQSLLHMYGGDITIESAYAGSGLAPANRHVAFITRNSTTAFVGDASIQAVWNRISDTDFGSSLLFWTSNDNVPIERMRINNDGNVAIGLIGPAARFHVQAAVGVDSVRFTDGVTYTLGVKSIAAGIGMLYGTTGSQLSLGANNTEWMRIAQTGEIGVGRPPTVGYKIDVQGTIRTIGDSGAGGLRLINALGDAGGSVFVAAGAGSGLALSGDGGPMTFTAGGADRMKIETTGNLNVGGVGWAAAAVRVHAMAPGAGARLRAQSQDAGGVVCELTADSNLQGQLGTNTNHPLQFYTNSGIRMHLPESASVAVLERQNGRDYNMALDTGDSTGFIPIGAVIAGEAAGIGGGGLNAFDKLTLGGGVTITLYSFAPAANVVLTSGQYRLLSRVSANFAVWTKFAY